MFVNFFLRRNFLFNIENLASVYYRIHWFIANVMRSAYVRRLSCRIKFSIKVNEILLLKLARHFGAFGTRFYPPASIYARSTTGPLNEEIR